MYKIANICTIIAFVCPLLSFDSDVDFTSKFSHVFVECFRNHLVMAGHFRVTNMNGFKIGLPSCDEIFNNIKQPSWRQVYSSSRNVVLQQMPSHVDENVYDAQSDQKLVHFTCGVDSIFSLCHKTKIRQKIIQRKKRVNPENLNLHFGCFTCIDVRSLGNNFKSLGGYSLANFISQRN